MYQSAEVGKHEEDAATTDRYNETFDEYEGKYKRTQKNHWSREYNNATCTSSAGIRERMGDAATTECVIQQRTPFDDSQNMYK